MRSRRLGGMMRCPPYAGTNEYRDERALASAALGAWHAHGTFRARSGHAWWHGRGTVDLVAWSPPYLNRHGLESLMNCARQQVLHLI